MALNQKQKLPEALDGLAFAALLSLVWTIFGRENCSQHHQEKERNRRKDYLLAQVSSTKPKSTKKNSLH